MRNGNVGTLVTLLLFCSPHFASFEYKHVTPHCSDRNHVHKSYQSVTIDSLNARGRWHVSDERTAATGSGGEGY